MSFSTAVVSGASSGIGQAIAHRLVADGVGVIGLARRFDNTEPLHLPVPGLLINRSLDVSDEEAVRDSFEAMGDIDLMVNCAGGGVFRSLEDSQTKDFRSLFESHVMGTFFCSMAAVKKMKARGRGRILVISSVAIQRAFVNCAAYSVAKAGQLALANVLREECKDSGVAVTTVIAGATDTPIWNDREGFDRKDMMSAQFVANRIVDEISKTGEEPEQLTILPSAGIL